MLESIANGTSEGLKLALNVGAMLIVFVALIAMIDYGLGNWIGMIGFGDWNVNSAVASSSGGQFSSLSLGSILGYIYSPIAWLVGASGDLLYMGKLLGMKMVSNEFYAFTELAKMKEAGVISERNVFLSTFALCGFANFSSIGIQLGGIGVLAPERKGLIAKLGMKSMIAGTLASLLSATVAGMVYAGS